MEETVRQELLAKTKQALDADDWNAVMRLWQPGFSKATLKGNISSRITTSGVRLVRTMPHATA